jgi:hypothetical protein
LLRSTPLCIVALVASCYRLGAYACENDDNCIDGAKRGVCEATNYCGYPDEECASGRRYDDLAGDGLAGECVMPGAGESGESSESGSIPACIDDDGDTFGEGDCAGPDCDDDNPNTSDGCVFIGPDGDDEAAGTRDAPWRTFARAVGALGPGSSLVVLPGTYTPSVHGMLDASCTDGTVVSGTAAQPIFVRAELERRAHLSTEGTGTGIHIDGCSYWRVRGLHVSSTELAGSSGNTLVLLRDSTQLELRRLLVDTNNRWLGDPLLWMPGSSAVLVEECEAYAFSGTAFYATGGPGIILRRVYAHGRGVADLPECVDDGTTDLPKCTAYAGADHAIIVSNGVLVENAIVEDVAIGIVGGGVQGATVLGSAVLGGTHGIVFSDTPDAAVAPLRIEDFVTLGAESNAVYLRSTGEVSLRNVSAIGSAAVRYDLNGGTTPCPASGCALAGANLLAIDAAGDGLSFVDTDGVIAYSNSFGSESANYRPDDEPIDDDVGLFRHSTSIAPDRIGTGPDDCIAFVPSDSTMAGAGENGQDVGANILYRYVDGVLGTEALWDPATGTFPCGAVVEGVNDDPANSCIGVHERLHVGTAGCPLPADFP